MLQEHLMGANAGNRPNRPPNNFVFVREEIQNVYFKSYLRDEFRHSRDPLPDDLRQAGNIALIISIFEFVFAFMSAI